MAENFFAMYITDKMISFAKCVIDKKVITLESAGSTPVPQSIYTMQGEGIPPEFLKVLSGVLQDAKVSQKNVRIVIPDSISYSRIADMPTLTEKEMISAIKYQADQFIPVPIDKVTISLEMLEENKKAKITKTLIVAAPNSHIHRITQLCEELALYPLNMENEVSAYFRILRHLKNTGLSPQIPSEGHLLVANIGSEATSLYVYDVVTMTPVMVHTFSIGTSLWVKDLMTNLQLDEQKAAQLLATSGLLATGADKKTTVMGPVLAEYLGEIKRYLLSLRQRTDTTIAPAKCLVLGSGAQVPGVEQALSQSTNLPVEMLSYEPWLTQNEVSQYFAKELYAFVPCVGASLVE